jgi:hypothetical protein
MTEQTSAKSSPKRARMSTPQMLHLMRLEVDRAIRHGYPISCMYYGLDGFASSDLLLHRRSLMPLAFLELKKLCVESDVRGLGIWTEGFQLAVFPHVTPEQIQELAERLLERARGLRHDEVPEDVPVTLSIGISHNLHEGEVSFESLVKDAESGMGMALASGGDQVAKWRAVETALDRLREELDEQLREIEKVQEDLFGEETADDELWGKQLVGRVVNLFHREPTQSEGVLRLEKEVIALLKTEIAAWAETSSANQLLKAKDHIQRLERRVGKLTRSLSETEKELRRIAAMKNIDLGVASIYRTVQGLAKQDDHYEAKAEMLKNIFEANVALRAEMATKA